MTTLTRGVEYKVTEENNEIMFRFIYMDQESVSHLMRIEDNHWVDFVKGTFPKGVEHCMSVEDEDGFHQIVLIDGHSGAYINSSELIDLFFVLWNDSIRNHLCEDCIEKEGLHTIRIHEYHATRDKAFDDLHESADEFYRRYDRNLSYEDLHRHIINAAEDILEGVEIEPQHREDVCNYLFGKAEDLARELINQPPPDFEVQNFQTVDFENSDDFYTNSDLNDFGFGPEREIISYYMENYVYTIEPDVQLGEDDGIVPRDYSLQEGLEFDITDIQHGILFDETTLELSQLGSFWESDRE